MAASGQRRSVFCCGITTRWSDAHCWIWAAAYLAMVCAFLSSIACRLACLGQILNATFMVTVSCVMFISDLSDELCPDSCQVMMIAHVHLPY